MATKLILVYMSIIAIASCKGPVRSDADDQLNYQNILSLVTAGEAQSEEERNLVVDTQRYGYTAIKPAKILTPQIEVLKLVESFLKFKSEMTLRLHALVLDNFDLFRNIYSALINKVTKMHSFSLKGIHVIRRIFEFAVSLMGQWEVSVPTF